MQREDFQAPTTLPPYAGGCAGTSRFVELADADLVVEAVFEDLEIKKSVFRRLDEVCRPDAILATNTSSFSVTELAAATTRPERVVGLHYFYHPAKNRLVEVVAGKATDPGGVSPCLAPAGSARQDPDCLERLVRLHRQPLLRAVAERSRAHAGGRRRTTATIERRAKKAFGIGMGPFELMNVTGVPIALHAATTLGRAFGPMYERRRSCARRSTRRSRGPSTARPTRRLRDRRRSPGAAACFVAAALVDEGVGTIEDIDIGARVGLRWRRGPFELMNHLGVDARPRPRRRVCHALGRAACRPRSSDQAACRPAVPLHARAFRGRRRHRHADHQSPGRDERAERRRRRAAGRRLPAAAADPAVRGIVIAGSGKAFVAGADIRFFVRNIEAGTIDASPSSPSAGRRSCARSRHAPSRSSRACTAWRSAAASSWRWRATRSSPRRRRRWPFPKRASASTPASAARSGRRAASARASPSGWSSPARRWARRRRWPSAWSTRSCRTSRLDAAIAEDDRRGTHGTRSEPFLAAHRTVADVLRPSRCRELCSRVRRRLATTACREGGKANRRQGAHRAAPGG